MTSDNREPNLPIKYIHTYNITYIIWVIYVVTDTDFQFVYCQHLNIESQILLERGLVDFYLVATYLDLTWIKDIHRHLICNLVNFETPN